MERVAEFEEMLRATHGRLAWAAKDKITEILSEGARLIKRAPRYPVFMLMLLEALILDVGHATGWRIWAWAKLVKRPSSYHSRGACASGGEAHHRAKANQDFGPQPPDKGAAGRYIRARLLPPGAPGNYKRDYLLPRLNQDGLLEKKPAGYADAMVATAGLLSILGLPLEVQGYWTEHSERSVLPTGLSLMEVPPQDKDLLGR